jgi:hypothetical protein
MDAKPQTGETYLVVLNQPGPNWQSPLPVAPEMAEQHHAIYQALVDDGLLISAGRLDGTPVMGISLFHQDADEAMIRARLDDDPLVKQGFLALDYRHWALLSGSLSGVKASS